MKLIEILWRRYADMRFGQLITNLAPNRDASSLWEMEEEALQRRLALVLGGGWEALDISGSPVDPEVES